MISSIGLESFFLCLECLQGWRIFARGFLLYFGRGLDRRFLDVPVISGKD